VPTETTAVVRSAAGFVNAHATATTAVTDSVTPVKTNMARHKEPTTVFRHSAATGSNFAGVQLFSVGHPI
jgi:hypothetical protein